MKVDWNAARPCPVRLRIALVACTVYVVDELSALVGANVALIPFRATEIVPEIGLPPVGVTVKLEAVIVKGFIESLNWI